MIKVNGSNNHGGIERHGGGTVVIDGDEGSVVNCVVGFCHLDKKTGWMFSGQAM